MKPDACRRGTVAALAAAWLLLAGCGSGNDTRQLDPQSLAMTSNVTAFYDDGELKLYETQLPVTLPIRAPSPAERTALHGAVSPFSHHPWVTPKEVHVQVTWTLANLDRDDPKTDAIEGEHSVEVLVDPWSEFGRYVPGITINGDNALPNFSGIDELYDLPPLGGERSSRIRHTFTYDDMDELATDFATAINIIRTVKPTTTNGVVDDPRVGLVNHAFAVENRSGQDPLTDRYRPAVIPALLGFDLSLRTREPANVAIEFTVEMIDEAGNRVIPEDSSDQPMHAPATTITLGG